MIVVPAIRTQLTSTQARDALLAAMPNLDREQAALLLALVWVETGAGGLMNFNAGNISAGPSYPGAVWRPPWFDDVTHPQHQRMLDGKAPQAFRAYGSAPEGFGDFARQLRGTFASVLAAGSTGSPAQFVQALHDSGYSRDYNAAHVPSFTRLREQFAPLVAHLPAGNAGAAAGVGLVLVAGVALYLLNRHSKKRRRRHASLH